MEENIGKALLIAAGIMIAIMILSLLILGYDEISNFYNEQSEKERIRQLTEFNKQFQNYQREDLRGTDLLTLINKVIDYNERHVYEEGTGYKRIKMTIDMKGRDIVNQFKFNQSDDSLIAEKITNEIETGTDKDKDNSLLKISDTEIVLITEAKDAGINKMTSTKLQKLSANIANIVLNERQEDDETKTEKRNEILTGILGNEFDGTNLQLQKIKEITSKYYQYMQFKRAHFYCEEMIFDPDTGRICEIKITIMTELNNNLEEYVVFN